MNFIELYRLYGNEEQFVSHCLAETPVKEEWLAKKIYEILDTLKSILLQ